MYKLNDWIGTNYCCLLLICPPSLFINPHHLYSSCSCSFSYFSLLYWPIDVVSIILFILVLFNFYVSFVCQLLPSNYDSFSCCCCGSTFPLFTNRRCCTYPLVVVVVVVAVVFVLVWSPYLCRIWNY